MRLHLTTDNENALVNVVETPNDDKITETWLSDIVSDEVVNIPKFSLVKKDRLLEGVVECKCIYGKV